MDRTNIVAGEYVRRFGLNHQRFVIGPLDVKARATRHQRPQGPGQWLVVIRFVRRCMNQRERQGCVDDDHIFVLDVWPITDIAEAVHPIENESGCFNRYDSSGGRSRNMRQNQQHAGNPCRDSVGQPFRQLGG
jgi:hypothetical protein